MPGPNAPAAPGEENAPTQQSAQAATLSQLPSALVRQHRETLLNESAPAKARASSARILAQDGSPEALAALLEALPKCSERLKLVVAESLGTCPNPQSAEVLLKLVNDPSQGTKVGAIRALGIRGDAEAAKCLAQVLLDGERAEDVRMHAALALADVRQTGAFEALTRAALDPESSVAEQALQSLAKRPYDETRSFFEQFLTHVDTPRESKIAVLEALGEAKGDPTPLLLSYASSSDEEMRSAAAWGLLALEEAPAMHEPLLSWLKSESNAEIRARLFNALQQQDSASPGDVLAAVRSETNPGTKLAALGAAAAFVSSGEKELMTFFDSEAVPELSRIAVEGQRADRVTAVANLVRAGTPVARAALENIAKSSSDPQARAMAEGALRSGR